MAAAVGIMERRICQPLPDEGKRERRHKVSLAATQIPRGVAVLKVVAIDKLIAKWSVNFPGSTTWWLPAFQLEATFDSWQTHSYHPGSMGWRPRMLWDAPRQWG
jgi:hypothetical protein